MHGYRRDTVQIVLSTFHGIYYRFLGPKLPLAGIVKKKLRNSNSGLASLAMKDILRPLCLVMVLVSSSLFAQAVPSTTSEADSSVPAVRHVGPSDPTNFFTAGYDQAPKTIGSEEDPVTADEYCAFLNTRAEDDWSYFSYSSSYYESSFMSTDRDWTSSPNATIQRTGNGRLNKYNLNRSWFGGKGFTYTVIPGHETDIIDAVSSSVVQKEFQEWRKNPTVLELCEYFTMIVSNRLYVQVEKFEIASEEWRSAKAIMNRYPDAAPKILSKVEGITGQMLYDNLSKWSIKGVTYQRKISSDEGQIINELHVKKNDYWARPSTFKDGQFQ